MGALTNFFSPLRDPATSFREKISNIALGFTFNIFWLAFILIVIHWLYPDPEMRIFSQLGEELPKRTLFFLACIAAPFWEEAAFRHIPYQLAKKRLDEKETGLLMILTSIIFGFAHGFNIFHLLVQGVAGLSLSWVYLKNGYSYKSSVTLHAMWNFFLIFIVPSLL